MENIDGLITIVELLALPLVVLLLVALFFVFVIRPFFAFLFSQERLQAVATLNEARRKKEQGTEEREHDDSDDFGVGSTRADDGHGLTGVRGEQDKIRKVADSDPGKAGELVRQWLKNDRDQ